MIAVPAALSTPQLHVPSVCLVRAMSLSIPRRAVLVVVMAPLVATAARAGTIDGLVGFVLVAFI